MKPPIKLFPHKFVIPQGPDEGQPSFQIGPFILLPEDTQFEISVIGKMEVEDPLPRAYGVYLHAVKDPTIGGLRYQVDINNDSYLLDGVNVGDILDHSIPFGVPPSDLPPVGSPVNSGILRWERTEETPDVRNMTPLPYGVFTDGRRLYVGVGEGESKGWGVGTWTAQGLGSLQEAWIKLHFPPRYTPPPRMGPAGTGAEAEEAKPASDWGHTG